MGYVEGLSDARTKLADVFNILPQESLEVEQGSKMLVRLFPGLG
jgi:hypothetical protein